VAQAILRVLDGRGRHVRPVWAARGVCVDLTDEELTRLLAEYPTLQAETIDQLAEPIMPWPRPGPSGPTMAPPAPNAWNLAMSGATALLQERGLTGQGVLIGVVGPDLPYLHPCLSGKIKHSKHFGDPKANTGTVEDLMLMHPLGVLAGFVKGRFQGVATGAVLSLATVTRGKLPTAELLAAIEWVLQPTDDPPPAAILLCVDFGGPAPKAVRQILAACRTAGVLPIIPAGNIPSRITGMAALPECLTIGALDQWKAKAGFSGTGPGVVEAVPIPKPDWAEPGVAIYGPNLEAAIASVRAPCRPRRTSLASGPRCGKPAPPTISRPCSRLWPPRPSIWGRPASIWRPAGGCPTPRRPSGISRIRPHPPPNPGPERGARNEKRVHRPGNGWRPSQHGRPARTNTDQPPISEFPNF
jgi:hypothetical protein